MRRLPIYRRIAIRQIESYSYGQDRALIFCSAKNMVFNDLFVGVVHTTWDADRALCNSLFLKWGCLAVVPLVLVTTVSLWMHCEFRGVNSNKHANPKQKENHHRLIENPLFSSNFDLVG